MEVKVLRKMIGTFFLSQLCANHKASTRAHPKFKTNIEFGAEKRTRLCICRVEEYASECGGYPVS